MDNIDLVRAFWGRLERRLSEYGYSSLRNFCRTNNMNYQVIVASRRKLEFPRLEDVIRFTEILNIDINALIYGNAYDGILEKREENDEEAKNLIRKYRKIMEAMKDADPIRVAAIEIILGIYRQQV